MQSVAFLHGVTVWLHAEIFGDGRKSSFSMRRSFSCFLKYELSTEHIPIGRNSTEPILVETLMSRICPIPAAAHKWISS